MITHYTSRLAEKAEMLEDFFAIKFDNSNELALEALPIVIDAIQPFAQELPMFVLRLAAEVDYQEEAGCI